MHKVSQLRLCLGIRITGPPRNDPESRPALTKHLPKIIHELLRLFMCSEMAAAVVLGFEYQIGSLQPPMYEVKVKVSSRSLIYSLRRIRRG